MLYADNPLIRPETLRRLLERRAAGDAGSRTARVPPGRSGPLWPRDHARTDMSSASSNGSMRRKPSAPRRCATPACCARRRRHGALAARGARRQCQGRILPHRCRRAGACRGPPRRRGRGAGGRTGRDQLACRTGGGRGGGAVLAARRRDGCRRDDDRPRVGIPVRGHRTGARRDDRAQRGVRAGRQGRDPARRSVRSVTWKAAPSDRTASSGRSPGCVRVPSWASRCMSATSSR